MRFRDLLRADKAGPAGIRAAMERAEAEARAASARLDGLTAQRARGRWSRTTTRRSTGSRPRLAKARRDLDRAELAAEELKRRLVEAEAAERQAALDAAFERGEAAHRRAVELVGEYGALVPRVRAILEELERLDRAIVAVNAELDSGRDGRRVPEPDRTARPQTTPVSLAQSRDLRQLVLPSSTDPYRLAFPARTVFGELVAEADRPAR